MKKFFAACCEALFSLLNEPYVEDPESLLQKRIDANSDEIAKLRHDELIDERLKFVRLQHLGIQRLKLERKKQNVRKYRPRYANPYL
jgi:hypothetical protein